VTVYLQNLHSRPVVPCIVQQTVSRFCLMRQFRHFNDRITDRHQVSAF